MLHTLRFFAIATAFIAVALFVSGCAPSPTGPLQATNWAYAPASIAVHPLSRFKKTNEDTENTMLVVHVELSDGDGFACRGVGKLFVTINSTQNDRLASELVDLDLADINRLRFDDVTRTYRVHFDQIPNDVERVKIKATFTASDEHTIRSASLVVVDHAK